MLAHADDGTLGRLGPCLLTGNSAGGLGTWPATVVSGCWEGYQDIVIVPAVRGSSCREGSVYLIRVVPQTRGQVEEVLFLYSPSTGGEGQMVIRLLIPANSRPLTHRPHCRSGAVGHTQGRNEHRQLGAHHLCGPTHADPPHLQAAIELPETCHELGGVPEWLKGSN